MRQPAISLPGASSSVGWLSVIGGRPEIMAAPGNTGAVSAGLAFAIYVSAFFALVACVVLLVRWRSRRRR